MKIKKVDLSKLKETISKVGAVLLEEDVLYEFAQDTLIHEIDIENDEELEDDEKRKIDFYNDGDRHYGMFVQVNEDNLMILETEIDGDEKTEIRAKKVDEEGKRIRMVIKTRKGWVTIFLGIGYFGLINELSDKSEDFVFVGGLTTQYKNLRTNKYEKVKQDDEEYSEFPSHSFNLWQLLHLTKKGTDMDLLYHPKPED